MSEPRPPQEQQQVEHPATGTWLKLDARDPEAEAAEAAFIQESARVRRGVWIGNFVMGFVAAAILTAVGYVLIPRLGRPASATAAEFIGTYEQRAQAATLLTTLNGQVSLWKLQHYDRLPDFAQYPQWEQFAKPTQTSGAPIDADSGARSGPVCGPYVQGKPVNPLNNLSTVWATDEPIGAGTPIGAGRAVGFAFNTATQKLFVTDVAGTRIIDPSAAPEAVAGRSTAAIARVQEEFQKEAESAAKLFRDRLKAYQDQHNGALPDFTAYPGWDQLVKKTDATGVVTDKGDRGPYLQEPVKNPHTGTARVQVVDKAPGLRFKASGGSVGYVLDSSSGKVWVVDSQGELVRD